MKKILKAIVIGILALAGLTGCSDLKNVKEIKLTSYKIDSIKPMGLKSVDVALTIGVDNPAMYLNIDGADGAVYRLGEQVGTFHVNPIALEGHVEQKYTLTGNIALSPNITILQVMKLATNFNMEEYTLDLVAPVKLKSGAGIKLKMKDKPIKELFED